MEADRLAKLATISMVRRSARVIGVVIAVFLLAMFIGEALQSEGPPEPIEPMAAVGLALLGVYIVAMFLALKWEWAGLLLGSCALGIFLVVVFMGPTADGKSVLPFVLVFWVPILLYWVCRHLERSSQDPPAPAL